MYRKRTETNRLFSLYSFLRRYCAFFCILCQCSENHASNNWHCTVHIQAFAFSLSPLKRQFSLPHG